MKAPLLILKKYRMSLNFIVAVIVNESPAFEKKKNTMKKFFVVAVIVNESPAFEKKLKMKYLIRSRSDCK